MRTIFERYAEAVERYREETTALGQILIAEKEAKIAAYRQAVLNGLSPTAASKEADSEAFDHSQNAIEHNMEIKCLEVEIQFYRDLLRWKGDELSD